MSRRWYLIRTLGPSCNKSRAGPRRRRYNRANYDMTRDDAVLGPPYGAPAAGAEQRCAVSASTDHGAGRGTRFNPAKLLLDPYARAITGGVDYAGPILDHTIESDYIPDTRDSFAAVPLGVVVPDSPPPRPIDRRRPMSESVIYELHVKGFTRLHPLVPEHLRGTYAGLAYPAVVQHLVDLGLPQSSCCLCTTSSSRTPSPWGAASQLWGIQQHGLLRATRGIRLGRHTRTAGAGVQRDESRHCTRRGSESSSMWSTTTPAKGVTRARLLPSELLTTWANTGSPMTSETITTSQAAATRSTPPNPACCAWCSTRCATGSPKWEWMASASTW